MADENDRALSISRTGRTRKPKQMFTPSKGPQIGGAKHTTKYKMNKGKAINKKIESTYQEEMSAEYKRGTLVITLPTAEFEAFRICAKALHTFKPSLGINVKVDTSSDQNGMLVCESVSVIEINSRKQLYRINLHLTTSVVSINGGKLTEFTDCHIDRITRQMENMGNFKEINKTIRNKLKEADKTLNQKQLSLNNSEQPQSTNERESNRHNNGEQTRPTSTTALAIRQTEQKQQSLNNPEHLQENNEREPNKHDKSKQTVPNNTTSLAIRQPEEQHINNMSMPNTGSEIEQSNKQLKAICYPGNMDMDSNHGKHREGPVCSVCDEACTEERIVCDLCGHWSHYRCENLSIVEISELENAENTHQTYTCRGCVSTETMLRSDIITEESNTSQTEGGSEQTEQHDKCVSTTPIERRDMWTNTSDQQTDKSALQKEYDKTLKQMESEIKRKDENIGDLAKQLATARAYIIKLEQKVNSLEKSNNIQEKTTNIGQQTSQPADSDSMNQRLSLVEQRLNTMEITALKERMSDLERRVGPSGNTQSNCECDWQHQKEANINIQKENSKNCRTVILERKECESTSQEPTETTQTHHFLGKRHPAKEPPWDSQGSHSQRKKRRKKKKTPVGQTTSQPIAQNMRQTEGTQMEQRNTFHQASNVPFNLNRPQPIQQYHIAHVPHTMVANRVTPVQHLQSLRVPWLMTDACQMQNLQRGMAQNREVLTSCMNFQ